MDRESKPERTLGITAQPRNLVLGADFHELVERMHDVVGRQLAEQVGDLLVELVVELRARPSSSGRRRDASWAFSSLASIRPSAIASRNVPEPLDVLVDERGLGLFVQPIGPGGRLASLVLLMSADLG